MGRFPRTGVKKGLFLGKVAVGWQGLWGERTPCFGLVPLELHRPLGMKDPKKRTAPKSPEMPA